MCLQKETNDFPQYNTQTSTQNTCTDHHQGCNPLFIFYSFYKELLSSSVLVPFSGVIEGENKQDGVQHFIAPEGTSSIVKYFINQSGKINYMTDKSGVGCTKYG